MAYAKASLIQDIRNIINDEPWETTSTTTGTGSTVAVPDGTKWAVGDVGEWSYSGTIGGEQFLVQSISTNDLTVVRGYNGTTAEAHSSGDRVVKNARYSTLLIDEAIERTIQTTSPTVWKVVTSSVTPDTTTIWFDSGLTSTDLTGLIDLVKGEQRYGASDEFVGIYGGTSPYLRSLPIRVERNMPTALVTSGIGLRFPEGFFDDTNAVSVYWRADLTATVATNNYSDITEGLLSEAIANGAAGRLIGNKEVQSISEDQRAGNSPPGTYVGTASWFELKSRELLAQYRMKLMREGPPAPNQAYVPGWW